MQLTFLILVFCCNIHISTPNSPKTWRRSRYIIDNRRNVLFSKKPSTVLLPQTPEVPLKAFHHDSFKQRLFPIERYHRDLTAEPSISEPKFYRKYGENSIPRKIVKAYRISGGLSVNPNEYQFGIFENQKNTSGVLDPHNFIQTEDVLNDVASKVVTTTEKVPTWVPNINEGVLVSVSSTATTSKDSQKTVVSPQSSQVFEFDVPTTTSYPWELSKREQGNQIDNANEKHVYETRIETVSYHQEVIFNSTKKHNWYQDDDKSEPKNYELPEENHEELEKNFELAEKNYEVDEVMSEGRTDTPESEENQNKFGYVLEGTKYRKYRVEERTADGFIVGEYGVVSHDDGSLRGVRYTADGNTNPKLIYDTLIKFLSL